MDEEIWCNDIAGSTRFTRTSTNAETTGPVGNGVTDIIKNKVISTGIGNWYYTFNGTAANAIKGIVLCDINTAIWTTIQAQASDDNFGSTDATQNFTILTRDLNDWSKTQGEVISAPRYDAYCEVDWSYQDYRILLNSTDVTAYQIGRIYLARKIIDVTHPSELDQPADLITKYTITEGAGGQYLQIPEYQRFSANLQIQRSHKTEIDNLVKTVGVNPSVIYFCDGLPNGELYFGTFEFGQRQTYGAVHGTDKINLSGKFTEGR